jgi:hypothetical protein
VRLRIEALGKSFVCFNDGRDFWKRSACRRNHSIFSVLGSLKGGDRRRVPDRNVVTSCFGPSC